MFLGFSSFSQLSTLKRVCMQAGLVWFSFWKGVCAAAMAAAGSGRGLGSFFFHGFDHLCFSLTLPSSPTFKGGVCGWVYWVFLWERESCSSQLQLVLGEKKSHLFFLSCIYTPINWDGGVWVLVMIVLIPLLGYLRAGYHPTILT